jgi:ABC-type branched-subunit amino acid transport system substrate-binding protein
LIALAVAGCGTSGSGSSTSTVTATGSTLTLYLSDPPAVQANPAMQDVVYGEELAFAQKKDVAGIAVQEKIGRASVSQNARNAIHVNSIIGYIGEVQSGQSVQTVGITNAEDVLEFSPTDDVTPVKDNFESFSSYGRTFASLPTQLTTSSAALEKAVPSFASAFKAAFRRAPSAAAINGYDAVWILLRVLKAEKANAANRGKVTASVIATLKANKGQASVADFTISTK